MIIDRRHYTITRGEPKYTNASKRRNAIEGIYIFTVGLSVLEIAEK